jgi:hypothetical protein
VPWCSRRKRKSPLDVGFKQFVVANFKRRTSGQSRIGKGDISMQEYDLYLDPQKPAVGLYVRKGAGLPDLADPKQWIFDGTAAQVELPADLVKRIEANGHAFRDMD